MNGQLSVPIHPQAPEPFAQHPELAARLRAAVTAAAQGDPQTNMRPKMALLPDLPWLTNIVPSDNSYKEWVILQEKHSNVRTKRDPEDPTYSVILRYHGQSLTRHRNHRDSAKRLAMKLAEQLDSWDSVQNFKLYAKDFLWITYILRLPGASDDLRPEVREQINRVYAEPLGACLQVIWAHKLWDVVAYYYADTKDLVGTILVGESEPKGLIPPQPEKLVSYIRDKYSGISVIWDALNRWHSVMDDLVSEYRRRGSPRGGRRPSTIKPNEAKTTCERQMLLLKPCAERTDGNSGWEMAANNLAMAAVYLMDLVEARPHYNAPTYWNLLEMIGGEVRSVSTTTTEVSIPSYTIPQVQIPLITALAISPIVLMCRSRCTYDNNTPFLDLLNVYPAIGNTIIWPLRAQKLEHLIFMAVFAVVFGSDPEDELAVIIEQWDKDVTLGQSAKEDRQNHGINSDAYLFKRMGGNLTPSGEWSDSVEQPAPDNSSRTEGTTSGQLEPSSSMQVPSQLRPDLASHGDSTTVESGTKPSQNADVEMECAGDKSPLGAQVGHPQQDRSQNTGPSTHVSEPQSTSDNPVVPHDLSTRETQSSFGASASTLTLAPSSSDPVVASANAPSISFPSHTQHDDLKLRLEELEKKLETMTQKWEEERDGLTRDKADMEAEVSRLRAEKKEVTSWKEQYQQNYDLAQSQCNTVKKERDTIRRELEMTKKEHDQDTLEMQKAKALCEDMVKEKTVEVARLQQKYQTAVKEKGELQSRCEHEVAEREEWVNRANSLKDVNRKMGQEIEALREKVHTEALIQEAAERSRREVDRLKEEKRQLEEQRDVFAKEKIKLVGKTESLASERDMAIKERDGLIEEKTGFMEEKAALLEERDAWAKRNIALVQERDALIEETKALLEAKGDWVREMGQLKADHERLEGEKVSLEAQKLAHANEFDGLVEKNKVLRADIKAERRMREDLQRDKEGASAERNRFFKEGERLKGEVRRWRAECDKLTQEIAFGKQSAREVKTLKSELGRLTQDNTILREQSKIASQLNEMRCLEEELLLHLKRIRPGNMTGISLNTRDINEGKDQGKKTRPAEDEEDDRRKRRRLSNHNLDAVALPDGHSTLTAAHMELVFRDCGNVSICRLCEQRPECVAQMTVPKSLSPQGRSRSSLEIFVDHCQDTHGEEVCNALARMTDDEIRKAKAMEAKEDTFRRAETQGEVIILD